MKKQIDTFIDWYDTNVGKEAGVLPIIYNATLHYSSLRGMCVAWGYYTPSTDDLYRISGGHVAFVLSMFHNTTEIHLEPKYMYFYMKQLPVRITAVMS